VLFFEFLQVAVGRRSQLSYIPSPSEWRHLYQLSEQQAVQGICYEAVRKLPREQWPDEDLLLDWVWKSRRIAEQNERLSARSAEVYALLKADGYDACLLKGQGNAQLYDSMAEARQAGDVDIWVLPHTKPQHQPKRRVVEYVQRRFPDAYLRFHHIDYPCFEDAEVEIHFTPIYLNNFWKNRKLKAWFEKHRVEQMCHMMMIGGEQVAVPTPSFNALFQLLHIYKHIFEEGLGLRQMMDYYYVMQSLQAESQAQLDEVRQMIVTLKLEPLAGAVMYIMQEVFGLPDEQLLVTPNRGEGVALLSDIMQSGNFGHYDLRYDKEVDQNSWHSKLHRYWRKTKRNLMLTCHFPHEAIWEPLFRLYHFFWRTLKLWKI